MKSTGIVRKIDELGRIVIPKELRKTLNIKDGENVEIFIEEDKIILKKFYKLLSIKEIMEKYINIFNKIINLNIILTDRENIIFTNSKEYSNLINVKISKEVSKLLEERKEISGEILNISSDIKINKQYLIIPIIVDTEVIGSIITLSDKLLSENERSIIELFNLLIKSEIS